MVITRRESSGDTDDYKIINVDDTNFGKYDNDKSDILSEKINALHMKKKIFSIYVN